MTPSVGKSFEAHEVPGVSSKMDLETKVGVLLLDDGCGGTVEDDAEETWDGVAADADAEVLGCDWLALDIDDDDAEFASFE